MGFSAGHLILLIILGLLIFGAGRVPRLMEDLAKGLKAFKKGMTDDDAPTDVVPSKKKTSSKKDRS